MNRKELQHELAKAQLELNQINQTSESAHQAMDAAQRRVESSTQRIASAQAAFGMALVKDQNVSEARQELDSARNSLAQANEDLAAVEAVLGECDSRNMDRKISDVQRRINQLNEQIVESVVQEEMAKLDTSAMAILTRAWAVNSHQDDTSGFGSWLAARFANHLVQPERKKQLAAAMHTDYKF